MSFAVVAAVESEVAHAATLPPIGFGLVAGAILLGLLGMTYAFRNVGNRH